MQIGLCRITQLTVSACSQAMCSVYIASNILALEVHLAVEEKAFLVQSPRYVAVP